MSTPLGSSQWMYSSGEEPAIGQSLKFNDDESQYLSWTPAAAGNRKTWTWSGWVKRGNIGLYYPHLMRSNATMIRFKDNNALQFYGVSADISTSAVFRDTSAWYHIVFSMDTTQATSTDRLKIYVNGIEQTVSGTYPPLNTQYDFNNNSYVHYIGQSGSNTSFFDGYMSNIYFIDGQALDPTSFGQFTNGYWEAKDYAGSYGTNGFHLTFQDDVVSEGFNAVTWTGNGTSQSVSGLGLSPDLIWFKNRSGTDWHNLVDTVRGSSNRLSSNNTTAEYTDATIISSIDADGFSVGSNSNGNRSGNAFVAWAWDAGTGSAASNTDGSITSTVKANPDYGFSIVSYTGNGTAGATIGHGLGVAPDCVITKVRSNGTYGWWIYNSSVSNGYLNLPSTAGLQTSDAQIVYGNGSVVVNPDSSVVTVGGYNGVNQSGQTFIQYCFAEVAGYSSIGSYSGTGSTVSVNTGFKAAWLLIKRTDTSGFSWVMLDNTRNPSGELDDFLLAETNIVETNNGTVKVLPTATGFDVTGTATSINASGGTYIYMAFADTREAAFWKDVSGQGNHWTPNNLDYRDSVPDSPTNNFATLNPLFTNGGSTQNFKEGNLQFTADGNYALAHGTFAMRTGKWYWETYIKSWVSVPAVGISRGTNTGGNSYVGYDPNGNVKSFGYESGGIIYGASGIGTSAGSQLASGQTTYTTGDVIGCSFDADVGELKFYKNGTLIYTVSSIDEFDWMPATSAYNGGINIVNFGQDSTFAGATTAGGNTDANGIGDFKYAPPSGYLALCTANLPTPSIVDGSEYFNTVLYTGNGSSQSITSVNHQPDLVWIKERSQANDHVLIDSVRGISQRLESNNTDAEVTMSPVNLITSIDTDGFSLGSNTNANESGQTYAAWNWKAGGTAVSNTAGSITSQVSANVDAGFSIVSYTGNGTAGATVGHGLSSAPDMIILKKRTATGNWITYHKDANASAENGYIALNLNSAWATNLASWNNTVPSSSVFTVGNGQDVNLNSEDFIGYCFHSVDGFSKVGSYSGNYNVDGPFIYTGFRPAFIIIKSAVTSGYSWYMMDSTRTAYNGSQAWLSPDQTNTEDTSTGENVDILSNGFKIRTNWTRLNDSGSPTYIYLAFAENPFKYSNAR